MKIAILGGSFNPVGIHHQRIVQEVLNLNRFDKVIILPCGPRPDKQNTEDIDPVFRATMLEIAFRGFPGKVEIDLNDLENSEFTRTVDIERRYRTRGEVWHVIGFDLVEGGSAGRSAIQRTWTDGERLWANGRFVVVRRKNFPFNEKDLPPRSMIIHRPVEGSSTEIRSKRFNRQSVEGLVAPEVAEYMERYNLYRGRLPLQQTLYDLDSPRLLLVADETNETAMEAVKRLDKFSDPEHPNLIVDIGGDGNKLKAIRKYWHLRLPFFGVNTGHRGYLQNDVDPGNLFPLNERLVVHHLPLLQVVVTTATGENKCVYGFNEVWVERETGQSAWLEVIWNNENRVSKVVGDGLILSTAAGSTGYARNICGFSLPTYVRELLMVGMAVSEPAGWREAIFPQSSTFDIRVLNGDKRPVRAFVDGIGQGRIEKITIKASKTASAELAFIRGYDIAAKHSRIQLPYFQQFQL
jgi:NAD+ kinase